MSGRFFSKIFALAILIAAYAPAALSREPSAKAERKNGRGQIATLPGAQKKHAFVVGIDRYDNLPAHAQLKKALATLVKWQRL